MTQATFTVRVVAKTSHREGTQIWRAAFIVIGMEGCEIEQIIQALTAFEHTRHVGEQDPARWITHFAGLESSESGKKLNPWIEIVCNGAIVTKRSEFRQLLSRRNATDA
jgi:hypothetical protein